MIGIPLRAKDYRWWEHVIDEHGNHVDLMTWTEFKTICDEVYGPEIEELAKKLAQRMRDSLEDLIQKEICSESLQKRIRP